MIIIIIIIIIKEGRGDGHDNVHWIQGKEQQLILQETVTLM